MPPQRSIVGAFLSRDRLNPSPAEYLRLSIDDRILRVQDIWASIAAELPNPTLPLWQPEELDRRWDEYRPAATEAQPWESVRREIEAELHG